MWRTRCARFHQLSRIYFTIVHSFIARCVASVLSSNRMLRSCDTNCGSSSGAPYLSMVLFIEVSGGIRRLCDVEIPNRLSLEVHIPFCCKIQLVSMSALLICGQGCIYVSLNLQQILLNWHSIPFFIQTNKSLSSADSLHLAWRLSRSADGPLV